MPDYGTSQLALIDSRVADAIKKTAKMGTVAGRQAGDTAGEPYRYWASVVFDGSSGTAMPVKCFESVIVDIGDRVGLVKFEGEWIIVGNYSLRNLGTGHLYNAAWGGANTTTAGAFVDMPLSPTLIMTKRRDHTRLRIRMDISAFTTVAGDVAEFGVAVVSEDASILYDETLFRIHLIRAGEHINGSGAVTTSTLPGGYQEDAGMPYLLTPRWRRQSGTGTVTVNTLDYLTLECTEVIE
jgi:hypothetical protein